jgi:hypothetical protein
LVDLWAETQQETAMKAVFAGAVALALSGPCLPAAAQDAADMSAPQAQPLAQAQTAPRLLINDATIARLKHALHLTPAQEPYWPAVESALRDLARHETQAEPEAGGVVRRLTRRAARVALNAAHLRHVMTAAMPLIQTLGDDQKRDALALARTMGLGSLALAY